jgi:hypothetical protein
MHGQVKYWEIIIENLRDAGWNCGSMATSDGKGRPIWVAAAERSDAGRFIVHSDQELAAFLELESAIQIAVRKRMNWEIIADDLSRAGWSWSCVPAVDSEGERSGLLTHTATTEGASLCTPTKS